MSVSRDVTFESVNDTDRDETDAIQPLTAEAATPSNLNRPLENLRERTERGRAALNALSFLMNMKLAVVGDYNNGGGTLEWGGAYGGGAPVGNEGRMVLTGGDLYVMPFYGNGEDRGETHTDGNTPWANQSPYETFNDGSGNVIRIDTEGKLQQHEGAHWVSLTIERASESLASVDVTVEGSNPSSEESPFLPGQREIVVTISRGDSGLGDVVHTITNVINAINASGAASALVTASLATGLGSPDAFTVSKTTLRRGLNAIALRIPEATLSSFWAATNDNLLREGDTLAIALDNEVALWESLVNTAAATITSSEIINMSRYATLSPAANDKLIIPLAKVIGDQLYLVNGGLLKTTYTATGTVEPSSANIAAVDYAGAAGGLSVTGGSVQDFLIALGDVIDVISAGTGTYTFERLGINQDPPDGSTRLHISDTGTEVVTRWDQTGAGALATSTEAGVIEMVQQTTGHTGIRAKAGFKIDDVTANEYTWFIDVSTAGASPAPLRRVAEFGYTEAVYQTADANTNTTLNISTYRRTVDGGNGANALGISHKWELENAGGSIVEAFNHNVRWSDSTGGGGSNGANPGFELARSTYQVAYIGTLRDVMSHCTSGHFTLISSPSATGVKDHETFFNEYPSRGQTGEGLWVYSSKEFVAGAYGTGICIATDDAPSAAEPNLNSIRFATKTPDDAVTLGASDADVWFSQAAIHATRAEDYSSVTDVKGATVSALSIWVNRGVIEENIANSVNAVEFKIDANDPVTPTITFEGVTQRFVAHARASGAGGGMVTLGISEGLEGSTYYAGTGQYRFQLSVNLMDIDPNADDRIIITPSLMSNAFDHILEGQLVYGQLDGTTGSDVTYVEIRAFDGGAGSLVDTGGFGFSVLLMGA